MQACGSFYGCYGKWVVQDSNLWPWALDALVQIEVLRMVRELRGSAPPALPVAPRETEAGDERNDANDEIWQTWY